MSFTIGLRCPTHSNQRSNKCTCHSVQTKESIFTAAEYGNLSRIQNLIEVQKKNINQLDSVGYSCLHYAAQHNQVAVVKYLLQKGIQVNNNTCGATPLHRAAFRGSFEACKILINDGNSTINDQDTSFGDRRTPLHKACDQGHVDIVKLLIESNADTEICDAKGKRAIDLVSNDQILPLFQSNKK